MVYERPNEAVNIYIQCLFHNSILTFYKLKLFSFFYNWYDCCIISVYRIWPEESTGVRLRSPLSHLYLVHHSLDYATYTRLDDLHEFSSCRNLPTVIHLELIGLASGTGYASPDPILFLWARFIFFFSVPCHYPSTFVFMIFVLSFIFIFWNYMLLPADEEGEGKTTKNWVVFDDYWRQTTRTSHLHLYHTTGATYLW